jgi:hypothetical protein
MLVEVLPALVISAVLGYFLFLKWLSNVISWGSQKGPGYEKQINNIYDYCGKIMNIE